MDCLPTARGRRRRSTEVNGRPGTQLDHRSDDLTLRLIPHTHDVGLHNVGIPVP
jgi:hypothetical protein